MFSREDGYMKRVAIVLILMGLFLPGAEALAGLREQVAEKVLENGLKVILLKNNKAPVATFQVWYRVGSRNEAWGKTGLSHMLEHMMFKGTGKVGPEEFSRIIQENGGNDNAGTSYDFTFYFTTLNADRVQIPIDLEADRMRNLILKEEDFLTERSVVMEERRLRTTDNPRSYVEEQIMAAAFQVQPYHWPTIGWMEDIRAYTLTDLKAHYRTYYQPGNAFIVAVGNFEPADLLVRIEKAFGAIPKGPVPHAIRPVEPPQAGERRLVVRKEAELPYLSMAYHVPNLSDPDAYVLEVISALLSGGKSSRFYEKLVREKKVALSAGADNSLLSKDPGVFSVSAEPLSGTETGELEKALEEEIERLKKEPVGPEELERAKNQLESAFVYGQDSVFYQAMLLGENEIVMDWRKIDEFIPAIRKVTSPDIARVAAQYLIPDNRTVGVLIPLPRESGKPGRPEVPSRQHITR
jgi:zinc protease